MTTKLSLILFLVLFALPVGGARIVQMPDLLDPGLITAGGDRLYIADRAAVYIYSLKDFHLQKKFGRAGEVPQGFGESIYTLNIYKDRLIVNSTGKLSFFTKEGNFLKEKRTPPQQRSFRPLGDKFIGTGILVDEKAVYNAINIYNADLKNETEIVRLELGVQPGKGTKIFHGTLSAAVWQDRLFAAGTNAFEIHIYNEKGEKLSLISRAYRKRKVTEEDKNRIINYLKTSPETKEYYDMLKPVSFPVYYPALKELFAADGRVYAFTWKTENMRNECFIFDSEGKYADRVLLPIKKIDAVNFAPLTIEDRKLYQLVKNESSKKWELHITPLNSL
ncbi:MAG: hypothetical protein KAW12_05385 [Candidatus Aminicenantes bacterium]|nr:hypothetical protein [Candidatus Aminicenantes bacterium]